MTELKDYTEKLKPLGSMTRLTLLAAVLLTFNNEEEITKALELVSIFTELNLGWREDEEFQKTLDPKSRQGIG